MNNLNDIMIFSQVAETSGLSSAATALRMSVSSVSRRLRALEAAMGVQLVHRSTRHISLTEAGEVLYKHCASALAVLKTAQVDTVSLSNEPRGTLRVHAAVGIGQWIVTEAAAAFKLKHPDASVDLYIDSDHENLMRDGFDLVVKTSDVTDMSLAALDLGPIHYLVVASSEYLARAGWPEKPNDLVHHNCLLQYGRRPKGVWHFIGPEGNYAVKVDGNFRSTQAASICKAAAAGIGIARVPEYVFYGQLEEDRLQVVFKDSVTVERHLKVFFPRSRHLPTKVKSFLECLQQADAKRLAAWMHPK